MTPRSPKRKSFRAKALHVYIDGACRGNPGPASIGVVLQDPKGRVLKEHKARIGNATNNIAEYTAMREALRLAAEAGARTLKVHSDSQLLVRQLEGEYRVKNETLRQFLLEIQALRKRFESVELTHVPREKNKHADKLANQALDEAPREPSSGQQMLLL